MSGSWCEFALCLTSLRTLSLHSSTPQLLIQREVLAVMSLSSFHRFRVPLSFPQIWGRDTGGQSDPRRSIKNMLGRSTSFQGLTPCGCISAARSLVKFVLFELGHQRPHRSKRRHWWQLGPRAPLLGRHDWSRPTVGTGIKQDSQSSFARCRAP